MKVDKMHSTTDMQLSVPGYTVLAHHHHKHYGMASDIIEGLSAVTVLTRGLNYIVEWQAIKVNELMLINAYKP